ncbi:MAG: ribonuclease P protein component [Rhodospirillaceae bacterium]|nr:MAG: ribonuclease P protein component [Rhodospirillaceae bacterium]
MRRTWSPLKQRADFLRIAAAGMRRVTPGFILQAAATAPGQSGRIGFTVSRKVGNAVARNRAKRRLRALADCVIGPQLAEQGTGKLDVDMVLIGRGEALTRDFTAMVSDLQHAVARVAQGKSDGPPKHKSARNPAEAGQRRPKGPSGT